MLDHAIDQDIAIRYTLGFVAAPLPGDERFQGMLSIPYLTPNGVAAIKFRNLGPSGGKYAQHSGQKGRLFNTQAYFDAAETIGIAEGEMDAIAATEHLGLPTLGVPGAQGWQSLWTPLLKDFTRVLIFADGDQPGHEFAQEVCEAIGWRGQIVKCPDGEDVSSLAYTDSLESLLATIRTCNQEDE